ncbi:fibronectin type III domain-containing protein [Flavobacterium sp. JLP]|uniref:fibronectin type III domain-containing protein n=1 Tax=Flavobacterium sp. JLP TaxID=2783793 RepID=UPI00188AC1A1|nr:fibronectin type III domain-containing protein [Flavobacterium sp. JLP]MBF4508141.1 fibronectin type III domain-containing protein [Flavobacterium sp. JLP]
MIETLLKARLQIILFISLLTPIFANAGTKSIISDLRIFSSIENSFSHSIADTEAPTAPTNLVATQITASSVTLSWTASIDNVGVVSYDIYQGVNILMGNSTATSFTVTPLSSNYSTSFKIRAKDAAGNVSVASVSLSIKTLDITEPTIPTKLTASGATATSINLSWAASKDNDAVAAYDIYQGGSLLVGTSTTTNFTVTGLVPNNIYTFTVKARDAAGNVSQKSVAVLFETVDTLPPTTPSVITTEINPTSINLSWIPSTDNRGVTSYEIFKDGYLAGTSTSANFNATLLQANTKYSFTITAKDAAGNTSPLSAVITVTTAPPIPAYCVSTGFSSSIPMSISRVQVGSLDTKQDASQSGNSTSPTTDLKKGISYSITLTATEYISGQTQFGQRYAVWIDYNKDFDFNDPGELIWNQEVTTTSPVIGTFLVPESAISGETRMRVTTQGDAVGIPYPCGDYTGTYNYGHTFDYTVNIINSSNDPNASSPPTNLVASGTTWTTTDLAWLAPANTADIVGYEIYKEDVLIGNSQTTNFSVTGLMQLRAYLFTVKAKKSDGTVSKSSTPVFIKTLRAPNPSVPTNLKITDVSATKIDISWSPSVSSGDITYYIYLSYGSLTNQSFGSTKNPYFTIKSLGPNRDYTVTVQAVDEASNKSPMSDSIKGTTLNYGPAPLPATDLTATEITTSSATLTWTPSKNGTPITSYIIYKDGQKIGTVDGNITTFNVTGLESEKTYSFIVEAVLNDDSYTSKSGTLTIQTVALLKYCIPGATIGKKDYISNVDFGAVTHFSGSSSYEDVTIYTASITPGQEISIITTIYKSSPQTESNGFAIWIDFNDDKDFDDEGELVWSSTYKNISTLNFDAVANFTIPTTVTPRKTRLRIAMKQNGIPTSCEKFPYGEVEDYSVTIKKPIVEFEAPTAPTNLTASNIKSFTANLSWKASTDNIGVATYEIYKNGILTASTSNTEYIVTGLNSQTAYSFTVKAKDYTGNSSLESNTALVTTLAADIMAPTPPLNLTASNTTKTGTILSWTASTDNVGVVSYEVYKDYSLLETISTTTYNVSNLKSNSIYTFTVKAKDEAGNVSEASTKLMITTLGQDVTPPTAPTDLIASNTTKSGTTLSWTASTDNIAVTGYNIYYLDNVLFATTTNTTYTFTNLIAEQRYSFTVKAKDADGNLSDASKNVIVDTLPEDSTPPTAPKNLTATTNGTTTILTWTASTDNVGVTSYEIYIDNTLIATSTTTTYTVKNLILGRDYLFTVKAKDRAKNLSDASNTVTVTTDKEILYCTSAGTDTEKGHINKVLLNSIDNTTKGGIGGYSDFTTISTNLAKGQSNTITIETWTSNGKSNVFAVWIDLNGDKDFEDANELIWSSALVTSTAVTGNFTIPNTAVNGSTRMRISMKQSGTPDSCETFALGEVEDYTVNIQSNLSVEDHDASKNLGYILHPNPAHDKLFVRIPENKTATYKITNVVGQNIDEGKVDEAGINISRIGSGIYIIELNDGEKSVFKKFIKK